MILQRGKTNTIWGWAKPGETIRVELAGQTVETKTSADGRWEARILPPQTLDALALRVSGSRTATFTNILVGDVWICGGQSNMEFPLSRARNGDAELKAANHPAIRLFNAKQQPAYSPASVLSGRWKVCTPQTAAADGGVSAIGYFFALKIQGETGVPIGLIKDCWGGTTAEAWCSAEALRPFKDFDVALAEVARLHADGAPEYGNYISHWYDEYDVGQKENWWSPALDDHDWKTVPVPGGFSELGVPDAPAVCYFRKEVVLTNPLPAGAAKIFLGVVERMDTTQINGKWVGASAWVENPRKYAITDGVLKPGTNLIAVRVFKTKPDGGFKSPPEVLKLILGDGTEIPLAGQWKAKVSVDAKPPHPLPLGFENWPTMPSVLKNGMIDPLTNFALAGVLWYQGEANVGRAEQYRRLLPAMIADWRKTFAQGDVPFYIVSLAAFQHRNPSPGDDAWAELREAQAFTAATMPHSGLALAIDLGSADDIHPIDKKEVGVRLALWALDDLFARKAPCSGPTFDHAAEMTGALRIYFTHTDGGLKVKGDKLGEFSIAGTDRKWHWANAKLDGDTVIVSSESVPLPKFVRYAWQANPLATLYNGAGLPAVPFRTDP